MRRREFLGTVPAAAALALGSSPTSEAAKEKNPEHTPAVQAYLDRIYDETKRAHACPVTDPAAHAAWRKEARPVLRRLLGLEQIQQDCQDWTPTLELGEEEDLGECTRAKGVMRTEPDVPVPFYLLRPKGGGPYPLLVAPHGHGPHGSYANVYETERQRARIVREDRDVAVQAAKRGFVAIAPATRGLGCPGVPDINGRHGDRDCRSQMVHCLLAGRTPVGERVWDMTRFLDWGLGLPGMDPGRVVMLGNSGGGVVTLFAAACDERIHVAVPSYAFSSFLRRNGTVQLCDCNLVPGLLRSFGDAHDIAGLVAPRWLLAMHGKADHLFFLEDVEQTAERTREVFRAVGVPERFELRIGPKGHRFYKDLMWPFIEAALNHEPATAG